ncbi:C2 calcium-dependent domain-containing protein 4C [Astyanax mexicanus]|uniref:C2 calcium-dependent domain-containing protein 4C n=1 Tax=Astyanax mexicanus TaxID=7994 RepID=UPI0020CB5220|nr:C2 calcium-dependent domain-containing protein 4C [Astyanax mexicanus]
MFGFGTGVVNSQKSPAARPRSWQNVPLTPGRIPSFIIPPKLPLSVSPRIRPAREDECRLLSPSSPENPSPRLHSPSIRARFRFTPRSGRKRDLSDLSDPGTRAAMSLEHVEKVTTPYGFCTLAASPHVRRRESLFHKRTQSVGQEGNFSSVTPLRCNTPSKARPCQKTCGSAPRPERKGLKLLLKSPRAALKTLTPSGIRKHARKTQEKV